MAIPFLARQAQLEAKIAEWTELAGPKLQVDHVTDYVGNKVYALTLSNPAVPLGGKRRHYFAQPHAHEPGTTAGMIDTIEQLVTGSDLAGEPSPLDVEQVLAKTVLTFNPIGNVDGRERAPVIVWDGSQYTNDQLWCWMRGEDPDNPGKMWKRLGLWDTREEKAPDPIGIVYEQIDEHRYVEPNRSHLSSYFRLFFQMDERFGYEAWLSLHQTEFVNSPENCMIILPLRDLVEGEILEADRVWGQRVVDAWKAAGYRPKPEPIHLNYSGQQAGYFRQCFRDLHTRMNIVTTEVKNNAADAPPDFQLKAQTIACIESINRLLE